MSQFPSPFSTTSPTCPQPVRDVRVDLYNYRLLRSLQTNCSEGQLFHCPYYKPFSALDAGFTAPPFFISADHYFEWRIPNSDVAVVKVIFLIHPAHQFTTPVAITTTSLSSTTPTIIVLWWDCPQNVPSFLIYRLDFLTEQLPHADIESFKIYLEDFCVSYYRPISPFDLGPPLLPSHPPQVPHTPPNPFTIPLVPQ